MGDSLATMVVHARRSPTICLALLLAALVGCGGDPPVSTLEGGCRSCHGDLRSPAPPRALDGAEDPSSPRVGAHEAHLFGTGISHPVACTECHLEPDTVDAPGHTDTDWPAELTWGPLATSSAAQPNWDHDALTCGNVYCHGATLQGGTLTHPVWNSVDGAAMQCDACHGSPPAAPHPQSQLCQACHAPVAGRNRTIADPSRHIDGHLDVADVSTCSGCHGSVANAAPPANLAGDGEPTELTVGAHQAHLAGGVASRPVACEQCHIVPEEVDDPGHVDSDAPAELTFGDLARHDSAAPVWDRDLATCSNVYCHGATLEGQVAPNSPVWNVADGTQAKCGTCHALPPAAPHPANDKCEMCHLPTAGPEQTIVNRATHVDGIVQVAIDDCTGCHGNLENLAPPVDSRGLSDPSSAAIGAHQAHLMGGVGSRPVACDTCHLVPTTVDEVGHRDSAAPAEVIFSGLALTHGATVSFDASNLTCAGSYCHGSAENGASHPNPQWTEVDGNGAPCGGCHGLPPPAPHPDNDQCMLCHGPTAGPDQTIADARTHVDGVLQVTDGTCVDCHGANDNSAPPVNVDRASDTTLRSVGAHRAHTDGRLGISRPISCVQCHVVPQNFDDPGHIDTDRPAELTWGPLASLGATPQFDAVNETCSNVYCHGATMSGGAIVAPQWTLVDGSQASCGSCHGLPPTESHPTDDRCDLCHLPTAGPNQTIANPNTHIDGVLQVAADCDSCHGSNGVSAPPNDLDGLSDVTRISVGAHRVHLSGGANSRPLACVQCHVVPAERDSPGHIDSPRPAELVFGPIATQDGATPSWTSPTCAGTYCHAQGGSHASPTWNLVDGSQTDCGGCHAMPPATPVHQGNQDCANCHLPTAGPNRTIANRATHVDGILQVATLDCASCHGGPQSPAPPLDLDGNDQASDLQVGAHVVHLTGGASSAPVTCDTCHLVPTQVDEPGHIDSARPAELTFNGRAASPQQSPIWDAAGRTCSNTYCHAGSGGSNSTPVWNAPGSAACGSCHGLPPALPHPQQSNCEGCHAPVAGPGMTIAIPSRHVDGVEDVNITGCDGCHGGPTNFAPPRNLAGLSDTAEVTVGAHQTHLQGGAFSRAVACETCHMVPQALEDPGHVDTGAPAELIFGALATAHGANPAWDRGNATCGNVYCHGGSMQAVPPNPVWNVVDGSQAVCGGCHGLPPPSPHPQNTACETCHLPTAGPGLTIADRNSHVDGVLQVAVTGCTGCHGTAENLAPPVDMNNRSSTTQRSVGAHQAHVVGGNFSLPVSCDTCHLVPQDVDDPGHRDSGAPAEVTFGGRAVLDGSQPVWISGAATCANTYCHGVGVGGTVPDPVWTTVDGSQGACGTCHALPPAAPHPANAQCELCHAPTAGSGLRIADRTTHIDGLVQVTSGGCTTCHGSGDDPAPPQDVAGNTATSVATVGAHQAHVDATSGISSPVACNQCHVVPTDVNSPGHIDTPSPAELRFGTIATADGASPAWDRVSGNCSNVYCHGATLADGSNVAPSWVLVDGSQDTCGACHGVPPSNGHPTDTRCELCHLPTAGPGLTIANPATHIDGILQAAAGCDACHGENGVTAPPRDLSGSSDISRITVGAHRTHLAGGQTARPVACVECHVVPSDLDSPGHRDTNPPAEVVFGPTAGLNHNPAWTSPSCSNTYCHAQTGAAVPSPVWNAAPGTQAECGGCHGVPPNTPSHQGAGDCSTCHLPTAGPGMTIANRATHVDGVLQVANLSCDTCHGGTNGSSPPPDLGGATSPADHEVGAHAIHISGGANSAAVACTTCHVVPVNLNDPGHVDTPAPAEVTWSGLASLQNTSPLYAGGPGTCADTYCHGGATSGGSNPIPTWSAPGSVPCGGCHGLPPDPPHPQVQACEICHAPVAGPNQTIAIPSRHVDGVEDVDDQQPCERCHGTPASPAPPRDLAGLNTSAQVGAHATHLAGSGDSRPVLCSECHITVNPATPNQGGHYDSARPAEVLFGPLSRTGGVNPTRAGTTCNNTYCHGATLPGGTNSNPSWTAGAQTCGSCHGAPPPDAVHGNGTATQCESCHPDVAGPNLTIINPSRHVDGVIDTSATCDACHGQNGNSAPPRDLAGLLTSPKVGAHTAHMTPSIGAPVACQTCHIVPNAYGDAGHADTPAPAEVTFGTPARVDGATPTYSSAQLRCSNTYCHGTSLPGGSTAVIWSDADGSESQCGACHGMPPADSAHSGVSSPNTCNTCHVDSAGPNQTITTPSLHIDGVVQVSGGACDSCHGAPPSPGNESYPGSAGAHATHATTLGFECATCHGNNGAGPNHNPAGATSVNRNNVDLIFNTTLSFPGGTTMNNGASASYNRTTKTCAVGCHNPRVGNPPESPNLSNTLAWGASNPTCSGCHDAVGRNLPLSHNLGATGDAGCLTCHLQTAHTTGALVIRDPDPADGFAYAPNNLSGLCKTCHDGSGGAAFGGNAPDVTPYWTVSSHGSEGYSCEQCHTYHGSTGGPSFLDASSTSCMASGCHANLSTEFGQVPGGPNSHHKIEGGAGIALACVNCHNPHLSQAHPNAAVNPDNKWAIYVLPDAARTTKTRNYNSYCLACHDGTPPPGVSGALNIATEQNGGQIVTLFKKGGDALHKEEHRGYACMNCHDEHGSSGTAGINRGRLLLNYMRVNNFNNGYSNKGSCSTPTTPGGFRCH